MMPAEQFDRLVARSRQPKSLVQFFRQSPLVRLELDFERDKDRGPSALVMTPVCGSPLLLPCPAELASCGTGAMRSPSMPSLESPNVTFVTAVRVVSKSIIRNVESERNERFSLRIAGHHQSLLRLGGQRRWGTKGFGQFRPIQNIEMARHLHVMHYPAVYVFFPKTKRITRSGMDVVSPRW